MEGSSIIKALYIILNAGYANDVMTIARAAGAKGATIMNARGESSKHEMFMGITVDAEKEIIIILTDESTADDIMAAIKQSAGIETPAHCVCFTMPVDKTAGVDFTSRDIL